MAIYRTVDASTTLALDLSDVLRACHVLAVSALDYYVHEIVREGVVAIYVGARPVVPGYQKLRVGLGRFAGHESLASAKASIESDVREQHSYLAFQHPDRIADAVRCMSDVKLWEAVGKILCMESKEVKDRLKLIVDRRNKIAHEADIDPTYGGQLWPISAADVLLVLDFLDRMVEAIDVVVATKDLSVGLQMSGTMAVRV